MKKQVTLLTSIFCCLFTLASCSKSPTAPTTEPPVPVPSVGEKRIASIDVVKAVAQPVEIAAGSSGELRLRLTILSGYHVNANPPSYSYLIPTEFQMAPAAGISLGPIVYPPPINAKLAFAEKPIAVYEGDTEIRATLKAAKSAKSGEQSLPAKLRIQACDNQVCYPPGTLELQIPVRIQ